MPEEKPIFTKKFSADFNMGADSLTQIANHEWNIEMQFIKIYANGLDEGDISAIKGLYQYIVRIYADRLHAIMWTTTQKEANDWEKELEESYNDWIKNNPSKVPIGLVEKLRLYKRWLFEIKQKVIKMGIPTKLEMTQIEAIKKAIEG